MADADTLMAFFLATAIFAYMPGPALIYATAQTIARGRRGGLMAAFGIHLGGYFHVVAATLGLGFLLSQVPVAYLVIKFAGAAYLVWLGFRMIVQRVDETAREPVASRRGRTFIQSVLVEVLNPKTAIFFIAFLPQFVDPAAAFPAWLQFLILGAIVNLVFFFCGSCCRLPGAPDCGPDQPEPRGSAHSPLDWRVDSRRPWSAPWPGKQRELTP